VYEHKSGESAQVIRTSLRRHLMLLARVGPDHRERPPGKRRRVPIHKWAIRLRQVRKRRG